MEKSMEIKSMEIKALLKEVESTPEYKEFIADNREAYLAHLFYMSGGTKQVGYYSKKTKKVTTFDILENGIRKEDAEPFQEKKHDIKKLNMSKIKAGINDALEIAKNIKNEHYNNEMITREILILQHLDIGQVFNITFITASFKTLNIKINAENKKVVSHELASLVGF